MAYIDYIKPPIPAGYQKISLAANATAGLTVPPDARYATIYVEDGAIRFRDDGFEPTSTQGHLIASSGNPNFFELWSAKQLANVIFSQAAGTAVLTVLYYKPNA